MKFISLNLFLAKCDVFTIGYASVKLSVLAQDLPYEYVLQRNIVSVNLTPSSQDQQAVA